MLRYSTPRISSQRNGMHILIPFSQVCLSPQDMLLRIAHQRPLFFTAYAALEVIVTISDMATFQVPKAQLVPEMSLSNLSNATYCVAPSNHVWL